MNPDPTYSKGESSSKTVPWLVAVIDIGTTSLRMQVSEIHPDGSVHKLESFSQAVSLGKDSFLKGQISSNTTEDCVHVLRIYRAKLDEYGIKDIRQIRVVATSAVKEARNRLAFQDRIFIATGFEIELLDEAEIHRLTYLGAMQFVQHYPETFGDLSLICEVSGGTIEVVAFREEEVTFSQSYRQGALRLRKTLEEYDTQIASYKEFIESQITRTVQHVQKNTKGDKLHNLLAMGGDIRFAANAIGGQPVTDGIVKIDIGQLTEFTNQVLSESTDRLVAKYHLSLPDAESLGPALLTYLFIAIQLEIQSFYVVDFNLRDGLVEELAGGGKWSQSIQRQTLRSAIQMGRKFQFDEPHAVHVAKLACTIFDQLRELHQLGERFLSILEMAAILHEVGLFVASRSYHKHSMYLIRNAEFFGISAKDVALVALVARYHRRAVPQTNHDGYSALDRRERVAVSKLAAIIRIAKSLDSSRNQRVRGLECKLIGNVVSIVVADLQDLSLEQMEIQRNGGMFKDIFGVTIKLQTLLETE